MPKLPLVEGIIKYIREKNLMFCMPGHKGGRGFDNTEVGRKLYRNFINADITEVDGVDNLHHPEGIIRESQDMLRRLYGSKKSYFLINGSTSGNLAMIFSCFKEGEKVIVERNCHRSIFNGIIMRKLKPVYIQNDVHDRFNVQLPIGNNSIIKLFDDNLDAKGIIITYPNYYGICCNLKFIIDEAHKRGINVLIDSAHGAHFGINNGLPESAVKLGGDFVVMSAHKTLPSLNQSAFLHVNDNVDIEKVDFYVSAFLSTSPSYMLMCSMDYARYYLECFGKAQYAKLINLCNLYKDKINNLEGLHVIDKEDLKSKQDIDVTRYVINVSKGYSGYKLYKYLKNKKIQCEMYDAYNVILIFSPFNTEEEFKLLYKSLSDCNLEAIKDKGFNFIKNSIATLAILPFEAIEKEYIFIDYKESQGKICKEAISPYPPGVPLVLPGEIIDNRIINSIEYYLKQRCTMIGIYDNNKIKIVN